MKTFAKILTSLVCICLIFAGVLNLTIVYPKIFNINILTIIIYFMPRVTIVMNILLSIFVLLKIFLHKDLIHKTVSVFLAIRGLIQITAIAVCFYILRDYIIIVASFWSYGFTAQYFSRIIIDLLAILICINAFKSFIKNKTALIISICAFAFAVVTDIFTCNIYEEQLCGD